MTDPMIENQEETPTHWEARIIDARGMVWFGPDVEPDVRNRMDLYRRTVPKQLLDTLTVELRPIYRVAGQWREVTE